MANDPYGFSDDALPSASGDATRAMWFGTIAAVLGSVGVCFCYLPYFAALPMGFYGAYLGTKHLGAADERDRAMATVATVSGLVSGIVSTGFVLFMLMYIMLLVVYFVFVVVLIGAGASGGQF
jgi:hypothetical protein